MQAGAGTCAEITTRAVEPPLVEAARAGVRFGSLEALQGFELQISRGEFVSLVGPSGCGKSTVLRLLAGLVAPQAGQVRVAGMEPSAARRERVRVSFVFQEATLLPWRSVAANVALPLELGGVGRQQRLSQARAALARVGLAEFAD